jgi:hypothetical protein
MSARTQRQIAIVALIGLAASGLAAYATLPTPAQSENEFDISGRLFMRVHRDEPRITMRSRWVFFPRDEYPWDNIGTDQEQKVDIHPSILTAYVNFGCHFEGYVEWEYEETGVAIMADGWVRRTLRVERGDQGGFFNNDLKFKCELLTKHRGVNRRLGELATMGGAPTSGFQMGISMAALMRAMQAINTLDRTEGSWGDYLYRTFKSMMTFNLMDENVDEVHLYISPEGDQLEFEIDGDRTAVFTR